MVNILKSPPQESDLPIDAMILRCYSENRFADGGLIMKIAGLQKLTLLDYPGRVACTVFLNGCNFRCPFCHNGQLLAGEQTPVMTESELLTFLDKRRGVLDGVCITGGEPTLHPALPDLLRQIRTLGYAVKLDTNGYRPEVLKSLAGEGLVDYVAMDVKNSPGRYAQTAGLAGLDLARIEESISYLKSGAVNHEFRTTVALPLHDEQSLEEMARWLLALGDGHKISRHFVQPFVDRDTVLMGGLAAPGDEMLAKFVEIMGQCAEKVELRGK